MNLETRTIQILVDKLDQTTLSEPEKQLVSRFESSQSNKVLKDMVSERLFNYEAGSLTIEEIKVMNENYRR